MTLYDQRIKDLVDATSFREPDKVPVGLEVIYWPISYAGVKLADVIDDPHAVAAAYQKFLDDIEIDFYAMNFGLAHSARALEALGSTQYRLADDGTLMEHLQTDAVYMTDDEYDELIADYPRFLNKHRQRNYKAFQGTREEAYEALKKAAIAMKSHSLTNQLIGQIAIDYEIVPVNKLFAPDLAPSYMAPFNNLFDNLRGIKDSLIDLRRRPDKVAAALEVFRNQPGPPPIDPDEYLTKSPIPAPFTIYHSECFLNNKQFDELFFQEFKKIALPYMEKGAKYYLKGEGLFLNTLDRYRELPKGSMIIVFDQDDAFEAFKAIGDYHTVATGINTDLLLSGTKQQCLDYVKRCFDTFAPGGGFIFMPHKPLISANEVNPENLIAVYEFANEYGKK